MELRDNTPTRNILVEVDVQNDFVNGSLAVPGGEEVVNPLNHLARAVRRTMGQVALTRDWHPDQTPHFDTWPVHCVADTDGAAFHPTLEIEEGDIVLSKGMGQTDGYSGMEGIAEDGTTLESLIDPAGRWENVRVFIGGLATDYCDKATAIGAAERFKDYANVQIFALSDAMRAVDIQPGDGDAAVAEMAAAGVKIITVEDALNLIDTDRLER